MSHKKDLQELMQALREKTGTTYFKAQPATLSDIEARDKITPGCVGITPVKVRNRITYVGLYRWKNADGFYDRFITSQYGTYQLNPTKGQLRPF